MSSDDVCNLWFVLCTSKVIDWLLLTGDFIDNIHQKWSTDYKKLERDHGYIQWSVGQNDSFCSVYTGWPNESHNAQQFVYSKPHSDIGCSDKLYRVSDQMFSVSAMSCKNEIQMITPLINAFVMKRGENFRHSAVWLLSLKLFDRTEFQKIIISSDNSEAISFGSRQIK